MTLADSVLSGDRLALARLLTKVENNEAEGRSALIELFPHAGQAHLVGVTGAPGAGKSSLVNQLAVHFRSQKKRVAIVAVDPSSPFTGGALLGDRVRMKDLGGDPGVFIRSMATRGSLGGLAQTTAALVQVFDAAGYELVMIETVGAGQGEVEIARLAHTTLVVEAPGFGDDIQAIKAGILEIADILVINKADQPGVENTEKALRSMLDLGSPTAAELSHHGRDVRESAASQSNGEQWITPIIKTVATDGTGIPELAERIAQHAAHLHNGGGWGKQERARLGVELNALVSASLMEEFHRRVTQQQYDQILDQVYRRAISPWEAVEMLLNGSSA